MRFWLENAEGNGEFSIIDSNTGGHISGLLMMFLDEISSSEYYQEILDALDKRSGKYIYQSEGVSVAFDDNNISLVFKYGTNLKEEYPLVDFRDLILQRYGFLVHIEKEF